jgi:hypothetical protein
LNDASRNAIHSNAFPSKFSVGQPTNQTQESLLLRSSSSA